MGPHKYDPEYIYVTLNETKDIKLRSQDTSTPKRDEWKKIKNLFK